MVYPIRLVEKIRGLGNVAWGLGTCRTVQGSVVISDRS